MTCSKLLALATAAFLGGVSGNITAADDYALGLLENCLAETPQRLAAKQSDDLATEAANCGQLVAEICGFAPNPSQCSTAVGEKMLTLALGSGWSKTGGGAEMTTIADFRADCESDHHAPSLLPRAEPISYCLSQQGTFALYSAILEGRIAQEDLK
ncbi:MAG: hypothetical protein AAFP28_01410 [Pseudomonadota bacterium]